ncbi:MAG: DUF711 family protein [Acidobacteriota bacterium]
MPVADNTHTARKNFNIRCLTAGVRLKPGDWEDTLKKARLFLEMGEERLLESGYTLQMKRVSTNPFSEYTGGMTSSDALRFLRELAAWTESHELFLSVGPIVDSKGDPDRNLAILPPLLAETSVFSAAILSQDGVSTPGISPAQTAVLMRELAAASMMANFQFAALAGVLPETPFFPAAFHSGQRNGFSIGAEAARLVLDVFADTGPAKDFISVECRLRDVYSMEFKALEECCLALAADTGWEFDGLDTSPAPMKEISIGRAVEHLLEKPFGAAGTLAVCSMITRVIQSVPVKKTGYCGLMLPVMEDEVLALRAAEGRYGLAELLSYSAVCGTGLDVIPLPGDVSAEALERLLLDVAALSGKLKKPLSARLIPIPDGAAGDHVRLDSPYLVPTTIFELT